MDRTDDSDFPADPFLAATVERALEPYRSTLSPASLAAMRVYLEDVLLSHPLGATLVQRARPREARAESDDRPYDGVVADPAAAPKGSVKGAGGGSK